MSTPVASLAQASSRPTTTATTTLGVVSFLNAKPLYRSLRNTASIRIRPDVPARLAAALFDGQCDLALLPVVDYWRHRNHLRRISDGCIASDGETMTVRVYSKIPPDQVTAIQGDSHSHTSVILAKVIWRELYGRNLAVMPSHQAHETVDEGLPSHESQAPTEAVLRIGDKVVRTPPQGFGFEVDLGAAWKHLTGLPFVFAAWYGLENDTHSDRASLARALEAARDAGVLEAEQIARQDAAEHGWPEPTAIRYLRDVMLFKLTPNMHQAMERFFELATRHGFLPR